MRYRDARCDDAVAIARLHAESWRIAYRGALSDAFLAGDVVSDRLRVWEDRLTAPAANQLVVVADEDGGLAGFACAYGGEDAHWGTLLDNIHVRRDRHRRGTGSGLVAEVAVWCGVHHPEAGLYLWVVEENQAARRFYERLGACDRGGDVWMPPGGGAVPRRRYAWSRSGLAVLRGKDA